MNIVYKLDNEEKHKSKIYNNSPAKHNVIQKVHSKYNSKIVSYDGLEEKAIDTKPNETNSIRVGLKEVSKPDNYSSYKGKLRFIDKSRKKKTELKREIDVQKERKSGNATSIVYNYEDMSKRKAISQKHSKLKQSVTISASNAIYNYGQHAVTKDYTENESAEAERKISYQIKAKTKYISKTASDTYHKHKLKRKGYKNVKKHGIHIDSKTKTKVLAVLCASSIGVFLPLGVILGAVQNTPLSIFVNTESGNYIQSVSIRTQIRKMNNLERTMKKDYEGEKGKEMDFDESSLVTKQKLIILNSILDKDREDKDKTNDDLMNLYLDFVSFTEKDGKIHLEFDEEKTLNDKLKTDDKKSEYKSLVEAGSADLWGELLNGTSGGAEGMIEVGLGELGQKGGVNYCKWYGFNGRVEWCAVFVSWVAEQNGLLGDVIPKDAGCNDGRAWFKNHNQWHDSDGTYTPKEGDIIYFNWNGIKNGNADHVGIVQYTDNGRVYTIEGNSGEENGGEVRERNYMLTYEGICGYGSPKY